MKDPKNLHAVWEATAQPFEANHWRTHCTRPTTAKPELPRRIWERLGFGPEAFAGCTVIDIGCGPTARMCGFASGRFLAIDPLWDYYHTLPGAHFEPYEKGYSLPAETYIQELDGQADWVVSLNALDHCYDLDAVLHNAWRYLRPEGRGLFSVDVDKQCPFDPTHPINLTRDGWREALRRNGHRIVREEEGRCYPHADGSWRENWGGGLAVHWETRKGDTNHAG